MRWQRWAALALMGAAAATLYTLIPDSPERPSSRQTEINSVKGAGQEQKLKQAMLKRDMTATERLARLDAKKHLRKLADAYASARPGVIPEDAGNLQKDHKQFPSLRWFSGEKEQEFRSTQFKMEAGEQKQLDIYLNFARKSLRKGHSYESPAFPQGNPKYVVAAEPAPGGKHGMIAVMDMAILKRVQDHQHKNLRLIPYPKEGKYKVESVHTDTLHDITVKTGHDNEKASHYYENEIVVTFAQAPSAAEMEKIEGDLRCKPARNIGNTYIFASETMDMKQLRSYFKKNWKPNYVEPHYLYMTNEDEMSSSEESPEIPNDLLFSEYQWNLPIIETNRGWKLSKGSDDVIVAVVDTGVDLKHPDLKGRLLPGYNVVSTGDEPLDDVGHGTHVAGIISANVNNSEGIAGMMWGGKILPVKALDGTGSGTTYSVAQGIIWATDHGAKVINMSLGNYADAQFLHEAIKYAYDRDVVLIAATGNDNTERPGYPAAYPEVLSVSATDYHLQRASFSNYGDYVDVMAPGESIASTYPDNQYAALSGTSMASPHVSALAALIRSVNPDLKNTEVMDIIRSNVIDLGDSGHDKYFGYGQIDVFSALEAARGNQAPLQFWPQAMQRKMNGILDKAK
ncbi:type VII secretion-associated serine protease mycosin [Fontibacillus phaseoli]|uniref:Type VII secretion-associated serine protease mycosin n=1 Tax=Fontibacillus phaseoli TaxID=1416533 RepID=A0A369BMF5_9BACL|nr:S8 family peptidase [Fontibacillus phaseoli]RCX22789.1 type VII secretion-associated serine protease mycosin [Fontibacillus phaseoli]